MIVNTGALRSLYIAFRTDFQMAFAGVTPRWSTVATLVPSTTGSNEYGWLKAFPRVREWIGDRQVNNLGQADYTIKNKDYESTIGVDRNDIEDDNIGIYKPVVTEFGRSAASFPDELVYGLLAAGWDTLCFDGQYFFDTDHPVLAADGSETSYANTDGGSGAPWFLLDDTRAIKPVLYQERKKFQFVAMDSLTDENVFNRKEFLYGIDGRCNVGFSFPQLCWGSKQDLTATRYAAARAAMMALKGDHGRPLGIRPTLLVCGASNEGAARKLLMNELGDGGVSNEWKGTARLEVVEWLP
ncbi:hypothetical protein HL658_09990 [Azospirillum sp. RWY-5-1]|uniref:Bacteriophage Mu GpT domain-containing protein n=1 Tax=Azospirillum oleiclasticum TaxID=2735135 RepID=A0ABX2T6T9_9PROT|nr:Mu-like prophage major head subunit gpT family protein [Azospirillum oleiclasticum]NYZ12882.1 hypothetical protein [Azospirillum oleiclasticum]NYZ20042.1 hypothetical protein [Azospirillum oleiclasticum]